jgi:hypothetical protein
LKAMHLARLRGAQRPARKSGAFKGGPRGTAKRRGVGREPKATETSGLEDDARAGISPINSKPLVLASDRKEHQWNERPTPLTAIENCNTDPTSGIAGALASDSATARLHIPGATTDGGRQAALPVIYQLRQDGVSWPAQALAAQGCVGVPAILRRLEWSTVMVHSAPTRPPWLDRKALQANGFHPRSESRFES